MIFIIKLEFKKVDEDQKDLIEQDINQEIKQNQKLWGADKVWLDDIEEVEYTDEKI